MAFPVVLITLLLMVQVTVVVRDALALAHAAREGARAAAVTADDDAAREAVRRAAGPLEAEGIEIAVRPRAEHRRRGGPVTVELGYIVRLRIPVVDRMVSTELPLDAAVTMRLERSYPTPSPRPTPSPGPSPEPGAEQ